MTPASMTRRDFVAATSLAATGAMWHASAAQAQRRPWALLDTTVSATTLLPDPLSADALRTLANAAVDAARAAGATYADIRVAESNLLAISVLGQSAIPHGGVTLYPQFMFGVRVLANGAWAFKHGTIASADAVTEAARDAVSTARGYATLNVRADEPPQRPVVTGHWESPYVLDPFTVPLMDQCALAASFGGASGRVRNGAPSWTAFYWRRETRVFAATDGSCVTQTFRTFSPTTFAAASLPQLSSVKIPVFPPASGGYECVARPGVEEEIKRMTEELEPLLWLPHRTLDVGRYPVVMEGRSVGSLFGRTIGRAMELDRVVGHEMGGSGGSYLSPVSETLSSLVASPSLTATAHRRVPTHMAARWDDEGVATTEFPLIREGRLVTYAMSCRAAAAAPGTPRSNGCAVAQSAEDTLMVRLPHVVIAPAVGRATVRDLFKDIRHGVYVFDAGYASTDSTFASGFLNAYRPMFEIRNGEPVSILQYNGLQFATPQLWKGIVAIGDASTVQPGFESAGKGLPSTGYLHSADAPAIRFHGLDVTSTRR
jgi:TldD protein